MLDIQQKDDQRQAVQSLLELENAHYNGQEWKHNPQSQRKNKKKKIAFNFVQTHRKQSSQLRDNQMFMHNQKLINFNRFRKARSLFDPMKVFKIGSQQITYEQPLTPQPVLNYNRNKMIHRHPECIRDLNFKSGHPSKNLFTKKDQICMQNLKDKSIEFLNGQSVIIQVQSYEQNFNKKQVEYLMNKTLGSKCFKSQMNIPRKQDLHAVSLIEIKSQDMKLENNPNQNLKKCNKNQFRLSSRMRFTSYINKKSIEKQKDDQNRNQKHHSSLDLKNLTDKTQLSMSLRNLLNNLKFKNYGRVNSTNINSLNQSGQGEKLQGNSKIFDRNAIFKSYEQDELKGIKSGKQNVKFKEELMRKNQAQKKHAGDKSNSKKIISRDKIKQSLEVLRITSPQKYYHKINKKQDEDKNLKIFNIKRVA